MPSPTVVGSTTVTEQQESRKRTTDASGVSTTYVFKATTAADIETYLGSVPLGYDFGGGELVEKTEEAPGPGGTCMLYVYTGKRNAISELEWQDLEKPLEEADFYQPNGSYNSTQVNLHREGINACKSAGQTGQDYPNPTDPGSSASQFLDFYQAIARGETSFVLQSPIYRNTSYSISPPDFTTAVPTQLNPDLSTSLLTSASLASLYSESGIPTGWAWRVKTLRILRSGPNGTYEIVAEWEGAKLWDPNIYGTPA